MWGYCFNVCGRSARHQCIDLYGFLVWGGDLSLQLKWYKTWLEFEAQNYHGNYFLLVTIKSHLKNSPNPSCCDMTRFSSLSETAHCGCLVFCQGGVNFWEISRRQWRCPHVSSGTSNLVRFGESDPQLMGEARRSQCVWIYTGKGGNRRVSGSFSPNWGHGLDGSCLNCSPSLECLLLCRRVDLPPLMLCLHM